MAHLVNMKNTYKIIFSLIIVIMFSCIAIFSCDKNDKDKPIQSTEKLGKVVFYDSSLMKNLEIVVEIVDDEYHRAKGLMFRENLADNQGMLFIFEKESPRYFWMKNTTLSLDIIFIDASLMIVKIHNNTTPLSEERYASEKPAQYVVEVRAGFTDRYQVIEGHTISWEFF